MKVRLAITGSLLVAGVVLAQPASAAPPADPNGTVVVSQERTVERVWVDVVGDYVDMDGVKTVSVGPGAATKNGSTSLAAGCTVEKWAGDPHKVRESVAPYYYYVVNSGYMSLSSGCVRDYIWMKLRQDRYLGLVGQLRDEDSAYAYPGAGREWLNVEYKCTSTAYTWYTESDLHQNGVSKFVKLCP